VHDVICDNCNVSPIIGVRYKSAVVPNYDLCATCESGPSGLDNAPYIKILNPSQCPRILIFANDENAIDHPRINYFAGRMNRMRHCRRQCNRNRQANMNRNGGNNETENNEAEDNVELQEAIQASFATNGEKITESVEIPIVHNVETIPEVVEDEVPPPVTSIFDIPVTEPVAVSPSIVEVSPSIILDVPPEDDIDVLSGIPPVDQNMTKFEGEFELLDRVPEAKNTVELQSSISENDTDYKRKRAKRWRVELTSLAEMGFTEFGRNMDLLDRFVGEPGKAGMEDVLNELLN
jgi:hypothetical protein